MAWDGMNRRKFPRVQYPCLVVIKHAEGEREAILSHTENVGIGGVCVIIRKNIKLFSPVEVELDLMDMANHIKCEGRVVWSVRRKSSESKKPLFYDLGVEFVNLEKSDYARIEECVSRLVKEGKEVPYT